MMNVSMSPRARGCHAGGRAVLLATLVAATACWLCVVSDRTVFAQAQPPITSHTIVTVAEPDPAHPGMTLVTMTVEVSNTDTVPHSGIGLTAVSSDDPGISYGTVGVGELPAGGTLTVTGEFHVPIDKVEGITLLVTSS